jgi:ankyrin repeat protein
MVSRDPTLMMLVEAIAAHDRTLVDDLLIASPGLAEARADVGASRQVPEPYLESIEHYLDGGDTALHIAAAAYEPEIIHSLMANGAGVNVKNRRGAEPLHYAADGIPGSHAWNPAAQAETIRSLIEAGADPNAADKGGLTPLHRAIRTRCAAAVRALLDGGADPRRPNGKGTNPSQLAAVTSGRGGSGSEEAKEQQQVIVELLEHHVAAQPK